jgi:hypothetical protein
MILLEVCDSHKIFFLKYILTGDLRPYFGASKEGLWRSQTWPQADDNRYGRPGYSYCCSRQGFVIRLLGPCSSEAHDNHQCHLIRCPTWTSLSSNSTNTRVPRCPSDMYRVKTASLSCPRFVNPFSHAHQNLTVYSRAWSSWSKKMPIRPWMTSSKQIKINHVIHCLNPVAGYKTDYSLPSPGAT